MKLLSFIFIRVLHKIIRVINYRFEQLYYRYFYSRPKLDSNYRTAVYLLLGGILPVENISDIYQKLFPDFRKSRIKEADTICDHIFDLLGSGPVKLSAERLTSAAIYESIDWHSDFKSGYHWDPKTFFRYIPYGHVENVDIKVPWELSRFQHLIILGQAYALTEDRKYSEEFSSQITDWIDNNPMGFGVNWVCTMDVAIRASNWLVAMGFFLDSDLFSEEFINKLYVSIYEHGKFIRGHLENTSGWTTNHYLADITGLFFISVYCPFFRESKEWKEFALEELHREIDKQVYPDGCSFETSTSYHRLALEMFFYSLLLGQRAGVTFSEKYINKIKKMFESSLFFVKPNGMIPQIGDNDSGRFLRFSNRSVLEYEYLLCLATVYYKDGNFKFEHSSFDEESFWVFGKSGESVWDNLCCRMDSIEAKSFPDAGWYIIRDKNNHCIISCGPNGGNGWHSHNDKLSFELMIDGQDIIVDPGTYVYTSYPEERNKFRSTEYHNTVKFEGYEQNDINEETFLLRDRVKIINAELKETDGNIMFAGGVRYEGIKHRRVIIFDKVINEWQIKDSIACPCLMNAKLLFHLAPDITFDGENLLNKISREKLASIEVEGHQLTKDIYEYSPEYGVKIGAVSLYAIFSCERKNKDIITRIRKTKQSV
jgi:hypothetical protein